MGDAAAGTVRILFAGRSPFRTDDRLMTEVQDSEVATLVVEGDFECRCFIKLPNATEVGWDPQHPESGRVHKVGHP
jgi:hypothetical protein